MVLELLVQLLVHYKRGVVRGEEERWVNLHVAVVGVVGETLWGIKRLLVRVHGSDRHVFVYLVTREVPSEFRLFMLRHADLLKWLYEWTVLVRELDALLLWLEENAAGRLSPPPFAESQPTALRNRWSAEAAATWAIARGRR